MPCSRGLQCLAEVAVVQVLEFKKTSMRRGGFVNTEIFHDA